MKSFFSKSIATLCIYGALAGVNVTSRAALFRFDTDPFAGSTALTTPGRQVVGGEDFIDFFVGSDQFGFLPEVFGINSINFLNDIFANIPGSGVNTVVLKTSPVPLAAGTAANEIAAQITEPGPGFFIYFNSGLDRPRLVFSTDLSDPTADLKVLARLQNLSDQAGRDTVATFTAANFQLVPDSASTLTLLLGAATALAALRRQIRS
jgi:hypothetical protein